MAVRLVVVNVEKTESESQLELLEGSVAQEKGTYCGIGGAHGGVTFGTLRECFRSLYKQVPLLLASAFCTEYFVLAAINPARFKGAIPSSSYPYCHICSALRHTGDAYSGHLQSSNSLRARSALSCLIPLLLAGTRHY